MVQEGGRLGVDIGGTFTDVALELGERRWSAKILTTPEAPERAVIEVIHRVLARGRSRPLRSVDHHSRHDLGDQCPDRAQGGEDRALNHRGLSRHDRDPPRKPLRAIRRQHRLASAAGAAPAALSGARAHRRARPGAGAARRGRRSRPSPKRSPRRRRGGRGRLFAQLHQPGARTRAGAILGAALPGVPITLSSECLAGNARIRALLDRLRQRLCPAADRPLSRRSRSRAARRAALSARSS